MAEPTYEALEQARARAAAAEAFKAWVHAFLDEAGIPADPDPEHTAATGCRISGRMRRLLFRAQEAEIQAGRLLAVVRGLKDWLDLKEPMRKFDDVMDEIEQILKGLA